MIIYVDILILINFVVDFLLICLTECFTRYKTKVFRKIIGAFCSALFSLYIFIPLNNIVLDMAVKFASSLSAVLIAFGFKKVKVFLINTSTFYLLSFAYAGIMLGVYSMFSPKNMSVQNGVIYFNISPLILISATVIFYLIFSAIKRLTIKNCEYAERCEVVIKNSGYEIKTIGMVDSGHSLKDAFKNSLVIIISRDIAVKIFGAEETVIMLSSLMPNDIRIQKKFRLIPVSTVSGDKLMPAVMLEEVQVMINKNVNKFLEPIAVISESELGDDYSVIVPSSVL